jgi:hypothetical protein
MGWWGSGLARRVAVLVLVVGAVVGRAGAVTQEARVTLDPVPAEVGSDAFRVSVDGHATDVLHAATNYYLLNFTIDTADKAKRGPVMVTVTAKDAHFWDGGVEVQPMRLGIRPVRRGASITFPMEGPGKLTITRPGDHFADAVMLFLFANAVDRSGIGLMTKGVRYFGAGVHRTSIDARSGDTIFLAPGAVVFGSLNLWQVHNVHVLGTGTIIYDGPQDAHSDEGWMHKTDWHVVVMDKADQVEIDGITCITRSRSWQVQMKDSHHVGFYNVKVIGGNPNDANQDGMDWLGGGDTTVRNSFIRASDDDFALQGNWDGYDLALMRVPGQNVSNITIEDTIVSTSISNTVRVNWPQKTFNSAHFHMSNVDVIHMGFGACKVPFALLEIWADPAGRGSQRDYRFSDIRLEDWYSLYQLRQPLPKIRDVAFSGIWSMDGPGMVASVAKGDVAGIALKDAAVGVGARVEDGAEAPVVEAGVPSGFTYSAGLLRAKQRIRFAAKAEGVAGRRFEWIFGDGTRAEGREVSHTFADAEGTLLDGSGRFRVLLHVVDRDGRQDWSSESVVLASVGKRVGPDDGMAGSTGFERVLRVPADGGYTFTLLTSRDSALSVDDGAAVRSPQGRVQVCGAEGNAVQPVRMSVALRAGVHRVRVRQMPGIENADEGRPGLLWEGPGVERQVLPKN